MSDSASASPSRVAPRLEDFPYRAADIIRFGDHDHQNHVNNVVFATYFESGRVHFMRDTFGGLMFGARNFVVGRLEINYLRELHWPGTVEIGVGVERIGRSSVTYAEGVFHDGVCAAYGRTTMVLIERATRASSPLTEDILERLRANQMRNA